MLEDYIEKIKTHWRSLKTLIVKLEMLKQVSYAISKKCLQNTWPL